jgi:lycopene cyclase domain-containing protein
VLKFGYVAMLAFTVVGSFWLELFLKVAVLKRVKRVVLTISPVAVIFLVWDLYAIHVGHWHFDTKQILGIYLPGRIPIEEFLFFVIVPLAAIMTIEAVRKVNSHWAVGDER